MARHQTLSYSSSVMAVCYGGVRKRRIVKTRSQKRGNFAGTARWASAQTSEPGAPDNKRTHHT
jgi:hypothetical protein